VTAEEASGTLGSVVREAMLLKDGTVDAAVREPAVRGGRGSTRLLAVDAAVREGLREGHSADGRGPPALPGTSRGLPDTSQAPGKSRDFFRTANPPHFPGHAGTCGDERGSRRGSA
jgi:hypothetical protein